MGNVGRFFCVALPFILTAASIICFLIAGLTGVTNNPSLYMFRVNVTDLQLSSESISDLVKGISSRDVTFHDRSIVDSATSAAQSAQSTGESVSDAVGSALNRNITAEDLGLADLYDINLWGYCSTYQNGNRNCTKAQFDWAATYLNTSSIKGVGEFSSVNVTLPSEVTSSLNAFKTVTKWTEVVYVIAMVALGVELFAGIFTYCSRAISCITYLVSGIATAAVIAAAAMITAMSSVVIGSIEATAKWYGVSGSINGSYLAVTWLGVAFAMAASLFWLFSACCCKRDHHARRKGRDDEKPFLPNGAYAPINDHGHNHGYNQQSYGAPRHNANARSNLAYEPYSHSNV